MHCLMSERPVVLCKSLGSSHGMGKWCLRGETHKAVVCGIQSTLHKILFTVDIHRVSLHVGII